MSVQIPEGYELEPEVDRTILDSPAYIPWTLEDLREFTHDMPGDTIVWIRTYHADVDDVRISPVEVMSSSNGHLFL